MNYCVPSWDANDNVNNPKISLSAPSNSNSNSLTLQVPSLDYEIAELTWENGQLAMHGLGFPRVAPTKYTWDKRPAGGTLESIVNQATRLPTDCKSTVDGSDISSGEMVNWIDHHRSTVNQTSSASATDFLVPCANNNDNQEISTTQVMESVPPSVVACSTGAGSCSDASNLRGSRVARVGMNNSQKWPSSCTAEQSMSMSGSGTYGRGRDSRQATIDTCDKELHQWFTSTASLGLAENTSSAKDCGKTADDYDSACHNISRIEAVDEEGKKKGQGKSSASTKRSRAATIHNQSERKRRDKINQRMKALQKLVPNSSKADKASMLDEVIDYLKQLQAQVQMMSRMNMSPMMLPLAMQQQIQMPMMSPMGPMGMAALGMAPMGMGFMDINMMGRPGMPPILPTPPTTFMPVSSWDNPGDCLPATSVTPANPLSAFLGCQSQPLTMDAYSRVAALYQQFQHQNGSGLKN